MSFNRYNLRVLRSPEGGIGVSQDESPTSASDDYIFVDTKHLNMMLQVLNEQRKNGHFCDVTLCVDGEKFPVHKAVITSFSPYFMAMFHSNLTECEQEHITLLSGVEASVVSLLLDYAYTAQVTINKGNVQSLLSGSDLLQISSVKAACCRFLERHIETSNCIGTHCYAEAHDCLDLARRAKAFTLRNFNQLIAGDEWLELPEEKVLEFLSCDDLEVEFEEMVFNAAIAWLHKDVATRSPTFHKVLECVRLPLVSKYFLVDIVETDSTIRNSLECRLLLEEARLYHLLPDRRQHCDSPRTRPRKNTDFVSVIVAVGGEDNRGVLRSVECYEPVSHKWKSLACLPFAVSKHGLVVSGGNVLYLAGGELRDCFVRYNPLLDEWQDLAPLRIPRAELGLASLNGYVYAVGGTGDNSYIRFVERYNPMLNTWSSVANLQLPVSSPAVTSFQGKLYVCGGALYGRDYCNDAVQVYDPHLDEWTLLPPMNIPRTGSSAAVLNGCIYVMGGWHAFAENTNKVEKFDPKIKTWTFVGSMKERRYKPGVAVLHGKIYILGGEDGQERFHDSIECYDPVENNWSIVEKMLPARSWLTWANLMIKKDVIGEPNTPLS